MLNKSFSLVELIVAIVIIAVLAAVSIPNALKTIEKAKVIRATADVVAISKAINNLYTDTGKFPKGCSPYNINGTVALQSIKGALIVKPNVYYDDQEQCGWTQREVDAWDGPYLDSSHTIDPWGEIYWLKHDYPFCQASCGVCNDTTAYECPEDSMVRRACERSCPDSDCKPPFVRSKGPDTIKFTCDDIVATVKFD